LDEEFQFTRNNPITLSVTVEVVPKIENLSYENMTVKDIPVEVEESDVEDTLKRLQNQKGVYEVADKDVELDDFVSFEFVDSQIEGKDMPAVKEMISKMGNEIFPPDLMKRVIGKKKDDTVEFTTTFDREQTEGTRWKDSSDKGQDKRSEEEEPPCYRR
jgi:FKBP-type peptidyl-prolyl cis-trans isomerase (trigger factor)